MLTDLTGNMLTLLERAKGNAKVGFKQRGKETVLDELYQQGSAKIRFARKEPGRLTEAVLINTSGGMTGGDEFCTNVNWGADTTAIVTTQAAERYYRSLGDVATVTSDLSVGKEACGLWLPQETIMFDGAAYDRSTEINLAPDARFLGVESTLFGRHAMGEAVENGFVRETWKVRRQGRLLFADAFGLDGNIGHKLNQPTIADGAKAISTVIYAGRDSEQIREVVNGLLKQKNARGGATNFEGLSVVRLFAASGQELRTIMIAILNELLLCITGNKTNDCLLPRVWMM